MKVSDSVIAATIGAGVIGLFWSCLWLMYELWPLYTSMSGPQ